MKKKLVLKTSTGKKITNPDEGDISKELFSNSVSIFKLYYSKFDYLEISNNTRNGFIAEYSIFENEYVTVYSSYDKNLSLDIAKYLLTSYAKNNESWKNYIRWIRGTSKKHDLFIQRLSTISYSIIFIMLSYLLFGIFVLDKNENSIFLGLHAEFYLGIMMIFLIIVIIIDFSKWNELKWDAKLKNLFFLPFAIWYVIRTLFIW